MEKICVYCGNPFISKAHHQKYCSEKCRDHTRWNTTRVEQKRKTKQDTEEIIKLYDSDLSTKEISQKVSRGSTFIYKVWHDAGLPKRLTSYQKSVLKLRQEGLCSVEIAIRLNITDKKKINNLSVTARAVGLPFTEEEIQRSIVLGRQRSIEIRFGSAEERTKSTVDFITENYPDWEYVSGAISSDDYMQLKCRKCGSVIRKSAVTIRHLRFLRCEDCIAQYPGIVIKEPSKKGNKTSERKAQKRRNDKIKNNTIDKGISLAALYKRDKGICYICGGECDYKCFAKTTTGHLIVGAKYPTIDHVIPISKGGEHSWDNIKLAHHQCNTVKSDRVVSKT